MECQLLLILTGRYVGYLPHYYAVDWEKQGKIRPMFVDRYSYPSNISVAFRSNEKSNATRLFKQCVLGEAPLK